MKTTATLFMALLCFGTAGPVFGIEVPKAQPQGGECKEWFFNFPEGVQSGTVLELNDQTLRSPANLRRGYDDYLRLTDAQEFRQAFIGKRFSRITLWYNSCSKQLEIQADEAVGNAALINRGEGSPIEPASAASAQTGCNPEDSKYQEILFNRKRGQKLGFDTLAKAGVKEADLASLRGNGPFQDLLKSGEEFQIVKNNCANQIAVMQGATTQTVQEPADASQQQRGPSLVKTLITIGASIASTGLMVASRSPSMMMLSAGIGGAPFLIDPLSKKFGKGKEGRPSVSSTVRYDSDGGRNPVAFLSSFPAPKSARGSFQMKGNWWEKEW
jgi:hypothetical protein